MGAWGCPHENSGQCGKVDGRPCDPGMKGCVLAGKYAFSSPEKSAVPAPRKKLKQKDRDKNT